MRHSRRFLILAAAVLVSALSVTSALAASVHFKKGGTPSCTISGTTTASATCTGSVAGLGGGDVGIDVTMGGFAVYQCQNPSTKQRPPGQNRVLVGPTTTPTTIS